MDCPACRQYVACSKAHDASTMDRNYYRWAQADDYALFQNSCFPPSHAHFLQPTCAAIPDNTTAKMASWRP